MRLTGGRKTGAPGAARPSFGTGALLDVAALPRVVRTLGFRLVVDVRRITDQTCGDAHALLARQARHCDAELSKVSTPLQRECNTSQYHRGGRTPLELFQDGVRAMS